MTYFIPDYKFCFFSFLVSVFCSTECILFLSFSGPCLLSGVDRNATREWAWWESTLLVRITNSSCPVLDSVTFNSDLDFGLGLSAQLTSNLQILHKFNPIKYCSSEDCTLFGIYTIQVMLHFCTDTNYFSLSHFIHLDHRDMCICCLDPPHVSVYGTNQNPKSIFSEICNNNVVLCYCIFPNLLTFVCQKLL